MDALLGGHEEEAHENHERYLITYADMITLLLALFIILFAIGQVDLAKFERFRSGLEKEFGVPALEGGDGILDGSRHMIDGGETAGSELAEAGAWGGHVSSDEAAQLAEALRTRLATVGVGDSTTVSLTERGVMVALSTDDVAFDSGSWSLRRDGADALDELWTVLSTVDNPIVVEGHTDDQPMDPPLTNWELSGLRAAAVTRYFLEAHGAAAERFTTGGYADTRPAGPNSSTEGRARNRRVELLVVTRSGESEPGVTARRV